MVLPTVLWRIWRRWLWWGGEASEDLAAAEGSGASAEVVGLSEEEEQAVAGELRRITSRKRNKLERFHIRFLFVKDDAIKQDTEMRS